MTDSMTLLAELEPAERFRRAVDDILYDLVLEIEAGAAGPHHKRAARRVCAKSHARNKIVEAASILRATPDGEG